MINPAGSLTITTPGDREIAITRVFNAPRHLVFDAFTRPELLRQWLGVFGGWQLAVCEIDLRVGGAYRYEWHGPDGAKMGARGIYREVVRPERIVATEQFDEPWYEGESIGTISLTERDKTTTLVQTLRYISKEVRDAVLRTPMETGLVASYDKLAELLRSAS